MNINTQIVVSRKIKELRVLKGFTAQQLANLMENKTTYSQILRYESGKEKITFPIMCDFAKALGVQPKTLYPQIQIMDKTIYGKEAPQEVEAPHNNKVKRIMTTVTEEFATACKEARNGRSIRSVTIGASLDTMTVLKAEQYKSRITADTKNRIIKYYGLDAKKYID